MFWVRAMHVGDIERSPVGGDSCMRLSKCDMPQPHWPSKHIQIDILYGSLYMSEPFLLFLFHITQWSVAGEVAQLLRPLTLFQRTQLQCLVPI